ncbi:MAG: M1 family metallopeptidase [bacterium]|nr:M1 family metallopeptidase [bacterium]
MRRHSAVGLLLAALVVVGCAPFRSTVRPVRYEVDARLEPATHTLEADVSIDLEPVPARPQGKRERVELLLHPDLDVGSLEVQGATLRTRKSRRGRTSAESGVAPTRHRLIFDGPTDELSLTLAYRGQLHQDVAAGEEDGEVHNFGVSAHVAEEGLYLSPRGYWYPRVEFPADHDPALGLADYTLFAQPLEGFELVAGVERDEDRGDGALQWSSPFPLDGLVLLGGPLERSSRTHGDVELHAVLAPGKGDVAADILDASAEYLERYEELIGPYPFREFTVLEAFFSSGFAFPTCTQIAGSQLSQYRQYRRHGYLDHELLHNWYGNGIFVDPRDGNWCEGLASYMGNYYGFVLDEDDTGARKQRRNQSNFLSAIETENDKPLGSFGLDEGAGRGIGYQKSAAVFHMLARKIGQDAMFAGLRRLTAQRMGRFASWDDLQQVFEQEAGVELDDFFEQWVRGSGAPLLELVDAEHTPGSDRMSLTISQGETEFELDVPLRLHYGARSEDVVVTIDSPVDRVELPCEPTGPTAVELDPDYHLFRRLKLDEVMPTSSLTRRADELLVVVPEGELAEGYGVVLDAHRSDEDREITVRSASEVDADDLGGNSVLVLGDAVRHPPVRDLLARTRCPVSWNDSGFTIEGQAYAAPREAVFLTVHHPDVSHGGVTVYYGNSAAALSNARVLGYYANSLLVFDTPGGSAEVESGEAHPRAEVVRRMDFEFHERIELVSDDAASR